MFNWTPGEYELRNGERVRLYATDGAEDRPFHGAVWSDSLGGWGMPKCWFKNGCWRSDGAPDSWDIMPPLPVVSDAVLEAYFGALGTIGGLAAALAAYDKENGR